MNSESKGGTRREFLKKTGAVAAGMALAGKAPAQAPPKSES